MAAGSLEPALRSTQVALPHGVNRDGALVRELRLRPIAEADQGFLLDTAGTMPPEERANALVERILDVEDAPLVAALVAGDREALLLQLRRSTLGETLDCVLTCAAANCGELMELELRVGDLLVDAYDDVRPSYEIVADTGDPPLVVAFRLPTVADLRSAALSSSATPEDVAAELLAQCVIVARRGSDKVEATQLDEDVRASIASAMAERDPQAEIELDLTCPSCGFAFSVQFDAASFFLKELDARAAALLSEVHALAFHYHWSEREILAMAPPRRERYLALLADTLSGSAGAGYALT